MGFSGPLILQYFLNPLSPLSLSKGSLISGVRLQIGFRSLLGFHGHLELPVAAEAFAREMPDNFDKAESIAKAALDMPNKDPTNNESVNLFFERDGRVHRVRNARDFWKRNATSLLRGLESPALFLRFAR